REDLKDMEAKLRRRGFLAEDDVVHAFYDERVPPDVCDVPRLRKWLKQAERNGATPLHMSRADLMGEEESQVGDAEFPDEMSFGQTRLPLEYRFEPGEDNDGVTLCVPREGFNQVNPRRLGWLVPGWLEEKVLRLIKSLPKSLRRNCSPAAAVAQQAIEQINFGQGDLETEVAAALSRISGISISPDDFQPDRLPPHLRLRIKVVDHQGETVDADHDVDALRKRLGVESAEECSQVSDAAWTRDDLTRWDFGALPDHVALDRGGIVIKGYPALLDQGESVSLRLFDSSREAESRMRSGLRRLFYLEEKRTLRSMVEGLPKLDRVLLHAAPLGDARTMKRRVAELICDRTFLATKPLPRDQEQFQDRRTMGRERLALALQEVASLMTPLAADYHRVRLALENRRPERVQYAVEDVQSQFARLTEGEFLTETPWDWLLQYPRYFYAIAARLEKLSSTSADRDQRACREVQARCSACEDRAARHRERGVHDPQLIRYRWMLEEYRVSLFAQELGTFITVSAKRL
ncbi:MAG: DUF3418 domain-containing protein, partial [Planctomycetales bacterium]